HSEASKLGVLSVVYSSSKSADEREWMEAVVRKYALPWHILDADEAKPFSELPRRFCAEPISVMPFAGLFRRYNALAASHGVSVILTGYGGDQVVCGNSPKPYYLADFLPFQLGNLFTALGNWRANDGAQRSLAYHFVRNVLRPSFCYWVGRSLSNPEATIPPSWIHADYLRTMRLNRRSVRQVAPACRSVGQQYFAEGIWKTGLTAGVERSGTV